jgi:hypothetical protein
MTTPTPKIDALTTYFAELAANGDAPIGDMPAQLLLARSLAALQEQRDNYNIVIMAAVDGINHIANRLREAGDLLDQGRTAEARAIIASQSKPLDGALLTLILGGGGHAAH